MEFFFKKSSGLTIEQAINMEWLETNGRGGYSSSTGINCPTRKYHGLLVSKLEGLSDKYVLLSQLEDIFLCNTDGYNLSAHAYPNFFQDGSFANFEEFSLTTHPRFSYQFADIEITKEILMPINTDSVLIKYSIKGASTDCKITIRPLVASRNFHALCRENTDVQTLTSSCENGVTFAPYLGMPTLFFQTSGQFIFSQQSLWYRNFLYEKEKERGYAFAEDLVAPGIFTFELNPNATTTEIFFSCSTAESTQDLAQVWQQEIQRREILEAALVGNTLQKQLQKVARSFIATDTKLVTAGYHWFLEWGRDAMIALPGLTLFSGQEELCFEVLKEFAQYENQGLLPNYLGPKLEETAYNSVDASLWFAWAIQQYYYKTKNTKAIAQHLWPTLKSIYANYKQGTLHDIKVQENGLLYAGNPNVNITWMDAKIDGVPVTARYGLQVEVNALWYNMLCFMVELSNKMLDSIKHQIEADIHQLRSSFRETFWNAELGYLYDYVNAQEKNSALRPNQLFAVSLFYSPLPPRLCTKIVAVIKEHLLTPYGLRSLAPTEPNYLAKYAGDYRERDRAYHNGVIWPWLLGHFGAAVLKTTTDKKKLTKIFRPILEAMHAHLFTAGVGTLSEIFAEQEFPHPDGCISQAWSVAEVLRLSYLLNC